MRYKLCISFLFSIHICWSRLEVDESLYLMGIVNYQSRWENSVPPAAGAVKPFTRVLTQLRTHCPQTQTLAFFFSYRKLMNWTYQISSIAGRESIYFVNPHKLCTVFLWPFNSKKHECHYKGKNLSLRLAINKSPTMPSRLKNINQLFFQCFLFQYIFKLKIKIASILLKNL